MGSNCCNRWEREMANQKNRTKRRLLSAVDCGTEQLLVQEHAAGKSQSSKFPIAYEDR